MSDYVFEAVIKLRVKNAEDFLEAAGKAEEFFSLGLESIAYSDDPDDDPYELESVRINWGVTETY